MSYLLKIKKLFKQVKGRFADKIPVGVSEYNAWLDDLRATYPMPTEDRDSIVFSVSSMIMHLGPQEYKKSKYYFYKALHAGAAKQVAAYCFSLSKSNAEALQRAKLAEATAPKLAAASNDAQG